MNLFCFVFVFFLIIPSTSRKRNRRFHWRLTVGVGGPIRLLFRFVIGFVVVSLIVLLFLGFFFGFWFQRDAGTRPSTRRQPVKSFEHRRIVFHFLHSTFFFFLVFLHCLVGSDSLG